MGWLFLLFTVVPVVELWLLIRIGGEVGALPTIAGVILMGMLGAYLAKREGLRVLREWQATVSRGQMPAEGLTGAALVLIGAVLLITPGVLSDVVGLLLLIPPSRRFIGRFVRAYVERRIAAGTIKVMRSSGPDMSEFFGASRSDQSGEREVKGQATVTRPDKDSLH